MTSWFDAANFEGRGGDKTFETDLKDAWGQDNGDVASREATYLASEGEKIAAYKLKSQENTYWYSHAVAANRQDDWRAYEAEVKAEWAADGGDVSTLRTAYESDQKADVQARMAQDGIDFKTRQATAQAALELANREEMTEEHAKWLVNPSCALLPSSDPLSCSRDAT